MTLEQQILRKRHEFAKQHLRAPTYLILDPGTFTQLMDQRDRRYETQDSPYRAYGLIVTVLPHVFYGQRMADHMEVA